MTSPLKAAKPDLPQRLDIFCAKEGEAWRVYVWPACLPAQLAHCFDAHGEAYPVYLDLQELERQMQVSGLQYKKREATDGSFEIEATGPAATVLSGWLSRLFQSGTDAIFG